MKVLLRALQIFLLLVLALGAFLLRCHNASETFIEGRIYFVDPDCYSRMTRVRMIAEGAGPIVRHHEFENYPEGIRSHATAPLDYLILAGQWLIEAGFTERSWGRASVFVTQSADLSGALVSPLLGVTTCLFLALWGWWITASFAFASRALRVVAAIAPALLAAISPVVVQATILGRPDHQSLLVFLLAVALGAEAMLARAATRAWAITAGLGWGMALWVSLYEPVILLVCVAVLLLVFDRRAFLARERRWEWGFLGGLLVLSFLVEGWRLGGLAPEVVRYFPAWARTVGELHSLSPAEPILRQWMGWLYYLCPLLLLAAQRLDRRAWPWLGLFLVTLGLTCWQWRWGYFVALVFAMTLPWQLAVTRRGWIAALVLAASLFGTAGAWDQTYFPDDTAEQASNSRIQERVRLRAVSAYVHGPFLAPWWESPAMAYWSRHSGVAGSSHESLPGIVDVSRFCLDVKDSAAPEILRRRQVEFVLSERYEAARLTDQASRLLGAPAAPDCLANRLANDAYTAEPYLRPVFSNLFFTVFDVDRAKLNP